MSPTSHASARRIAYRMPSNSRRACGDSWASSNIAYIGSLTPGVDWRKLWQMAERCNVPAASDTRRAEWIITQANRAFICGSDVVVRLSDDDWEMEPGGRFIALGSSWCNQDVLVTGNVTVPALTEEQISRKPTYYPHYAE